MDDFEKAVLISFNYGGAVDPGLKARAAEYIDSIKASPECWSLCVERFGASAYAEVRFWCLSTLHEVIAACYSQLDAGAKQTIKGALLTWLQRDCAAEAPPAGLPPFLRNKLAQALVGVLKHEYPDTWPNFFSELVSASSAGPGLADMFGRIMVAVDEDIISLDIPRSADETKLSMHVKDAMREACIGQVAGAWYALTQAYRASRPDLAAFVLGSAGRYVHWMDIGLVANDKFIPLLGELLDCGHAGLRGAAIDVMIEVVTKRMEPAAKVALVQQLKVAEACERLSANLVSAAVAADGVSKAGGQGGGGGHICKGSGSGSGGSAGAQQRGSSGGGSLHEDPELLGKYAKLLAALAGEVMDALKRVENVVISFNATGLGVNDEAGREAAAAAASANALLESLTRAALGAFSSGLESIALPLVGFIGAYVQRLRALVKRGQALPAGAALHLQAVFEGVAAAARYPEDGANEEQHYASDCGSSSRAAAAAGNGAACSATNPAASSGLSNNRTVRISGDAAYQAAREEQWEVEERRKELLVLFRNTAKLAFPEALAFVGGRVQAVLARAAAEAAAAAGGGGGGGGAAAANGVAGGQGGGSAGGLKFQDSELAVTLVYELGEGAPEEAMRPGSGGLSQLVLLLLEHAGSLPAGQHRLVALALLETCVRYCKLLQQAASAAAQQQQQGGGGGGGGGGGAVASVLPGVLGLFLGPRGLGHPSAAVATRGAYLLSRLVKMLRNSLRPYLGELLRQLQPYLEVVATQPPPSSSAAVGTSRDAAAGRAPVTAALVDDRLYVFESVGLLLGQEELQPDEQLAALQQLLQPLLRQVEANLGPAAAEPAGGGGAGSASWAILQSLEAIARLNKGFKAELCSRRPQLGAAFLSCLEVALAVPQRLPANRVLRARFIALLHRLVECLMSAVLPYLPPALEALLAAGSGGGNGAGSSLGSPGSSGSGGAGSSVSAADLIEVLALLVQLVMRFKEALAKLLEAALPVAVLRVNALLGPDWDWSGRAAAPPPAAAAIASPAQQQQSPQQQPQQQQVSATLEDAREKGELQRSLFSLLLAVTANNVSSVLLTLPPPVLDAVMTAVARSAATHVDPSVRRCCIQVFARLVADWVPAGGAAESLPGFRSFAVQQLGGQACVLGLLGNLNAAAAAAAAAAGLGSPQQAAVAGPLDARDAGTVALIGEAAAALKLLQERCGDELAVHLCGAVLPDSGLPGELQAQLVGHVRESDGRALKEFLRELLLSARAGMKQQQQQ